MKHKKVNHFVGLSLLLSIFIMDCAPPNNSVKTPTPTVSQTPNATETSDNVSPSPTEQSPTPSPSISAGGQIITGSTLNLPSNFLNLSTWDFYSANLKWNSVDGAKSYKVYQDGKLIADNVTDINYLVKDLRPNTSYIFEVTAVNDSGESNKASVNIRTSLGGSGGGGGGSSGASNTNYLVQPQISITSPLNNAVVNGTVVLSANIVSPNTISRVEFFNGTTSIGYGAASGNTYNLSWDTTSLTSGSAVITAKVTDYYNNTATSSPINLTIDQLPVITSITPNDSKALSASGTQFGVGYPILLTANASDTETSLTDASYTWSSTGNVGSFNRTDSNTVVWTSPSTGAGPYNIKVTVSDGTNSVEKTIKLYIKSGTATVNITGGQH